MPALCASATIFEASFVPVHDGTGRTKADSLAHTQRDLASGARNVSTEHQRRAREKLLAAERRRAVLAHLNDSCAPLVAAEQPPIEQMLLAVAAPAVRACAYTRTV